MCRRGDIRRVVFSGRSIGLNGGLNRARIPLAVSCCSSSHVVAIGGGMRGD